MPARRKKSVARRSSSRSSAKKTSTKDLFVFVVILLIIAAITYILTYNAIMGKVDEYTSTSNTTTNDNPDYQLTPQIGQ